MCGMCEVGCEQLGEGWVVAAAAEKIVDAMVYLYKACVRISWPDVYHTRAAGHCHWCRPGEVLCRAVWCGQEVHCRQLRVAHG